MKMMIKVMILAPEMVIYCFCKHTCTIPDLPGGLFLAAAAWRFTHGAKEWVPWGIRPRKSWI